MRGRVVVLLLTALKAWNTHRWIRVVGQVVFTALAIPCPPSRTTTSGAAIREKIACQAAVVSPFCYIPAKHVGFATSNQNNEFIREVDPVNENYMMDFINEWANRP